MQHKKTGKKGLKENTACKKKLLARQRLFVRKNCFLEKKTGYKKKKTCKKKQLFVKGRFFEISNAVQIIHIYSKADVTEKTPNLYYSRTLHKFQSLMTCTCICN